MDPSNYVGQTGAGFVVVKGGQVVGTYPTQSAAEQAYNGGGGGSAPPGQVVPNGGATSTADQLAGLDAAAGGYWNGDRTNPQAVAAAYAAAGNGGGGNPAQVAFNKAAADSAANVAYQTAIIAGMSDRLAFDKATEAWNETFKQKQFETGQANTVVDQAFRQRQADLSQGNTAIDQAFRQGQANNTNALSYLNLQSSLRGPANAFEYAKLLSGTPGGLADIVRAAGGAYQLPQFGGGAPGNPTPLSIQTMIDDVNRYTPTAGGPAPVTAAPPTPTNAPPATSGPPGTYNTVNGVKTVAEMAQELHVAGWGGNPNDAAAVAAAYGSTTKGAVTPNAAAPTAGGGIQGQPSPVTSPVSGIPSATSGNGLNFGAPATPTAGAQSNPIPAVLSPYIPSYGPLPRGNQIAPQAYNTMDPSQKALFLDAYGNAGWDPNDITAQYQRSLRAYGGPQAGAVGF